MIIVEEGWDSLTETGKALDHDRGAKSSSLFSPYYEEKT